MKKFDYDECIKDHGGYAVTRGGLKVRLLCDDKSGGYPIVGLGEYGGVLTFAADGKREFQDLSCDLFTPSKRIKKTYWVNIRSNHNISIFHSKKEANFEDVDIKKLACVEIEIDCEEGEGL